MSDLQNDPVRAAFAALTSALKAEAVSGDFDRTAGFLRRVQDIHARWHDGKTAHTARGPKGGV